METEQNSPIYLVAGLGNPGRKYENTRHNIGFDVINELFRRTPGAVEQAKFDGKYAKVTMHERQVVLLKPETYMNRSGQSIAAAMRFYKSPLNAVMVVCDDLALPLGRLRIRRSGSSGGQKGLQDTIEQLGSQDFPRLRVGIDPTPPGWDTANYVLSKFAGKEIELAQAAAVRAADAIYCWLIEGIDAAMNKFNRE